ncbi:MAG TPA: ABC transporter permease, partial [Bryobacteraceae bacterium]|nr:ABC transporter permease [Bryobacteraceae bacterium]
VYGAGRGTQRGAEPQRGLLASVELALACVLLVGASLLAESLIRLDATSPGFQIRNVLTMQMTLPRSKYATTARQAEVLHQVLDRVSNVPGVVAAGEISDAPLGRNNMATKFVIEGAQPAMEMGVRFITPGYLRAVGMTLVTGRDVGFSDTVNSPLVALVNQTAARRQWPGLNPIGQRIRFADDPGWFTVAGVVADIKHLGLDADEGPAVYIPYTQKPWDFLSWATLVVRTSRDPMNYVSAVRNQIHGIDKDQPVSEITTLERSLARSTAIPLLMASVVSAISLLALIMAVIGVYGILAYAAAQRVPEISIRLALGASPPQLLWMLVRQGMLRAMAGIAVGLAGAWMLTRFLASMLFGVEPHDAATFAATGIVLLIASLAAVSLPAWRALRIDPVPALRAD